MPDQYQLGDIVAVLDKISMEDYICGTIQKIEPAEEQYDTEAFYWIYVRANEDFLNTNMDSDIGLYWTIVESTSPYLNLIHRGTTC